MIRLTIMSKEESMIYIERKWLENMYGEKELSIRQIANLCDCSSDTIRRRLVEWQIDRRPNSRKIPFDEMVDKMAKEGRTVKEMMAYYHCSHTTMRNELYRRGYGSPKKHTEFSKEMKQLIIHLYQQGQSIQMIANTLSISFWKVRRTLEMAHVPMRGKRTAKKIPKKEELVFLYEERKLSSYKIANLYNVAASVVISWLIHHDIPIRRRSGHIEKDRLRRLYLEGWRLDAICREFHTNFYSVQRELMKMGIYRGYRTL